MGMFDSTPLLNNWGARWLKEADWCTSAGSLLHILRERDRHRQREANNTLTATPKPFLQHSTDNQKILATGGVVLKANSLTLGVHPSTLHLSLLVQLFKKECCNCVVTLQTGSTLLTPRGGCSWDVPRVTSLNMARARRGRVTTAC